MTDRPPTEFPPYPDDVEVRRAVLMFVDMVQSTDISIFSDLHAFHKVVRAFQEVCLREVDKDGLLEDARHRPDDAREQPYVIRLQGDEMFIAHVLPKASDPKRDALAILRLVRLATRIKRSWFLWEGNLQRMKDEMEPFDLAAGLHVGPVTWETSIQTGDKVVEGHAVHFAKRVEQHARHGEASRLLLSDAARSAMKRVFDNLEVYFQTEEKPTKPAFLSPQVADLRGVSSRARLHEIQMFWDSDADNPTSGGTPFLLQKTQPGAFRPVPLCQETDISRHLAVRNEAEETDEIRRAVASRLMSNPWDLYLAGAIAAGFIAHGDPNLAVLARQIVQSIQSQPTATEGIRAHNKEWLDGLTKITALTRSITNL